MLDRSRIDFKIGSYGVAPGVALQDSMWLPRVQAYRRQLGARMVAYDKAIASKKIPSGEYYISRKIDGEFNVLIFQDGEALLVNPGGTVRIGLPVLKDAIEALKSAGIKNAMIPGELHVQRSDGKRARVHDVSRFARKPENQGQVDSLCFAPFDILTIDSEEWAEEYSETWKWLSTTFGKAGRCLPVETKLGDGSKAVLERFDKWVDEEEGEGVVARSDEHGWFKVKPRHTLDVAVIGFAEGTDDRAGMLHDLLLGIYRTDGTVQVLGRVGGGFTDDQRREFLSDLRDMVVDSEYAEINSDRVAYEMVRPEWVIEISCLDLISSTTRGATIDRMVLEWEPDPKDAEKGIWKTARRLPLCSVISPQFQRIRDDKSPNPIDCRLSQLTDLVEIEMAEATTEDLQLPKSEILKRDVRVKELKGKLMVRKLMMWKTNKEDITRGEYPAYVVHLTDFSPNRQDPVKREIRVSDSRTQIEALYAELEESSFVKGWNPPLAEGEEPPAPPAKKAAAKKAAAKKKSPSSKDEEEVEVEKVAEEKVAVEPEKVAEVTTEEALVEKKVPANEKTEVTDAKVDSSVDTEIEKPRDEKIAEVEAVRRIPMPQVKDLGRHKVPKKKTPAKKSAAKKVANPTPAEAEVKVETPPEVKEETPAKKTTTKKTTAKKTAEPAPKTSSSKKAPAKKSSKKKT